MILVWLDRFSKNVLNRIRNGFVILRQIVYNSLCDETENTNLLLMNPEMLVKVFIIQPTF